MARGVELAASCWVLRVKGFRRGLRHPARPPSWQEWRHRRSVQHESGRLRGLVVVHRLKLGQDAVASTRSRVIRIFTWSHSTAGRYFDSMACQVLSGAARRSTRLGQISIGRAGCAPPAVFITRCPENTGRDLDGYRRRYYARGAPAGHRWRPLRRGLGHAAGRCNCCAATPASPFAIRSRAGVFRVGRSAGSSSTSKRG